MQSLSFPYTRGELTAEWGLGVEGVFVCVYVRMRVCVRAATCAKDFEIIQLNGCQRFDSLLGACAPVEPGSRNC